MLSLDDPLWEKLDDAYRDRNIPLVLLELAHDWNDEAADELFWGCLHHQGTCYGATYASIPHLIEIAEPSDNRHQRLKIALFLAGVALSAREQQPDGRSSTMKQLPGLPDDLAGWDLKLDTYRSLAARLNDPKRKTSGYERSVLLPRYQQVLEVAPVNDLDLKKIRAIRSEFISLHPRMGSICERAFLESECSADTAAHLLGGVAAATGLIEIAHLLCSGEEGQLRCSNCGANYDYLVRDDRVAIYAPEASEASLTRSSSDDQMMRDYKAGTAAHADGFMTPATDDKALDPLTSRLLLLAKQGPSRPVELLLRSFLGRIHCCSCGELASISAA